MKNSPIVIGGVEVKPGERKTINIPLAAMPTHSDVEMKVVVIHGRKPGPCLFICAAIHGDEINGVEIIRRILKRKQIDKISGTLIAIPIVNIHGFITHQRYLPDGRDLNRCFPGSSKGPLASRMAHTFFTEIVHKCTHGIDLHTGARHRTNLPQIRADLSNETVKSLAITFGVPAIIDSKIRDGSLREAGGDIGIPILLYEAGEALRFDEICVRAGVRGIVRVMRALQMLPKKQEKPEAAAAKASAKKEAIITRQTAWVRAPYSGVLRTLVPLGGYAPKGSVLGVINDPLGETEYTVMAPQDGIVIGRTNLPLTYEGDALFHLAYYRQASEAVFDQVEAFQERMDPDSSTGLPLDDPTEGPIL